MKQSDIKVSVRLGDVLNANFSSAWDELCEKYGINEWCINEGRASGDDTVEVSLEDVERWGLLEKGASTFPGINGFGSSGFIIELR